jgi:PAT family beta-lactamase induction signal transducer AmpG
MFASTVLVYLVGIIHTRSGSYNKAWGIVLLAGALIMFFGWVYLFFKMPKSHMDSKQLHSDQLTLKSYLKSYVEFFAQPKGWRLVFYFFFAVIGEGVLMGMKIPMFLDAPENGGLGIDLTAIGVMTPIVIGSMIAFGVYGGIYLKKHGLQRVFFWMGLWMFLPNICMSLLALFPEVGMFRLELSRAGSAPVVVYPWVLTAMVLETAGYAFAFACYKAFEAMVSKSSVKHKGTYGAIIGSLNLLGLTLGSGLSGVIQEAVGYFWLFNISIIVSIPGWIMILFLPVKDIIAKSDQLDAEEESAK